jgi:membrane associated rhomboid family serine protease
MMAPATIVVLLVTAITTFLAFRNPALRDRWIFQPREILAGKQFERMVTSGFIHADWMHFAFNAYSFFSFAQYVEMFYGAGTLLLIYFASILGGSLLSLFLHRHHEYRALGASGGVSGVIFASIFLLPDGSISFPLLPVSIPAYVYAIGFLVVSFVLLRRGTDNIGHDAHLGGAIVGLLTATALYPSLVLANPWMFVAVLGLSAAVLLALALDPLQLLDWRPKFSSAPKGNLRYQRYDEARDRNQKMAEVDRLLDKVAAKGIHSLSDSERKTLDRLSKDLSGRR